MKAVVSNDAWGDAAMPLDIQFHHTDDTDYLFLSHRGWPDLPASCAADERRRFAALWLDALSGLGVA